MTDTFIPAVRERVHVRGQAGIYFVLAVDRENDFAYVIKVDGGHEEESGVEHIRLDNLARLESESGDGPF